MTDNLSGKLNNSEPEQFSDANWTLTDRYPDASLLFTYRHPQASTFFAEAIIVFDTNLLVSVWEKNDDADATVNLIGNLSSRSKLMVPAQVAREYFNVKSRKVVELKKIADDLASHVSIPNVNRLKNVLKGDERLKRLEAALTSLTKPRDELKDAAKFVSQALGQANLGIDNLSTTLESALARGLYDPSWTSNERRDMHNEASRRRSLKIPPSYKDETYGDFIIWKSILKYCKENKKSCILVTHDNKVDWVIQGLVGQVVPQPELIQEFARETGGLDFAICRLSDVLRMNGENEAVVQRAEKLDDIRSKRLALTEQLSSIQSNIDQYNQAVQSLEGFRSSVEYSHPGRSPAYGETPDQHQARWNAWYNVERPIKLASIDADLERAWITHNSEVTKYIETQNEIYKLDEEEAKLQSE